MCENPDRSNYPCDVRSSVADIPNRSRVADSLPTGLEFLTLASGQASMPAEEAVAAWSHLSPGIPCRTNCNAKKPTNGQFFSDRHASGRPDKVRTGTRLFPPGSGQLSVHR